MEKNILQNRRYARAFSTNIYPEKKLVENLIERTFKLVPSKQNMMPYLITVFGPECIWEKEEIFKLSTREYHKKQGNPNVQIKAPYLLVFSTRLVNKPNKWVQKLIKEGHDFKACDKDEFQKSSRIKEVAIEIGMFSMILTELAIENKIDTAYTLCHFNDTKNQKIVKNQALFMMSLGYQPPEWPTMKKERKVAKILQGETKPNMKDVIIWK